MYGAGRKIISSFSRVWNFYDKPKARSLEADYECTWDSYATELISSDHDVPVEHKFRLDLILIFNLTRMKF